MDGNRRWAKRRGLDPIEGHEEGVKAVRRIMKTAREMGVEQITLYAFSTENWKRTKREVAALFRLLVTMAMRDRLELVKEHVRFRTIGDLRRLPGRVRAALRGLARATENNTRFTLNLAVNYGGRSEIVRAVRSLVRRGIGATDITEEAITGELDTAGQSDPDLIIRTGGEQRLSNFLPWQSTYSELYFTKRLWPEFSSADFEEAVHEYQRRQRRFGK